MYDQHFYETNMGAIYMARASIFDDVINITLKYGSISIIFLIISTFLLFGILKEKQKIPNMFVTMAMADNTNYKHSRWPHPFTHFRRL